jgi:hypothetical protein
MSAKYVFNPEVTEEEWLNIDGNDRWAVWRSMPHTIEVDVLDRKRILLVAFLLRQVADQITDSRLLAVIEAGEKGADGLISVKEMWAVGEQAYEAFDSVEYLDEAAHSANYAARKFLTDQNRAAEAISRAAGLRAAHVAGVEGKQAEAICSQSEEEFDVRMRRLVNEVHGNPFRPVAFDRSWLTPTVTSLAAAVYEEREMPFGLFDNGRLGILADALEEAGCDKLGMLGHLRDGGEHIRGCHVIDLILGKE